MKVEKKGTDRKNLLVHIKYHLLVQISFTCGKNIYLCIYHLLVPISFTFAKITYLCAHLIYLRYLCKYHLLLQRSLPCEYIIYFCCMYLAYCRFTCEYIGALLEPSDSRLTYAEWLQDPFDKNVRVTHPKNHLLQPKGHRCKDGIILVVRAHYEK